MKEKVFNKEVLESIEAQVSIVKDIFKGIPVRGDNMNRGGNEFAHISLIHFSQYSNPIKIYEAWHQPRVEYNYQEQRIITRPTYHFEFNHQIMYEDRYGIEKEHVGGPILVDLGIQETRGAGVAIFNRAHLRLGSANPDTMGLAIKDWLKQRDKDYADKHPSINDYHGYHTRRFEAMTDETVMFIVGDGHDQEAGFTLREIYYYHPERIKNTFDYDDDIDDQVRESMKELLNCSDAGELLFGW